MLPGKCWKGCEFDCGTDLSYTTCSHAFGSGLGLLLFFYKTADALLTYLHVSNRMFLFFSIAILVILTTSPRLFILAETMDIILIAAFFYLEKDTTFPQRKRMHIPVQENRKKYEENSSVKSQFFKGKNYTFSLA